MDSEIRRLQSQVAILLACARTRLEKARWRSIQELLQEATELRQGAGPKLSRLLQEREYLRAVVEKSSDPEDAAIMTRQML